MTERDAAFNEALHEPPELRWVDLLLDLTPEQFEAVRALILQMLELDGAQKRH